MGRFTGVLLKWTVNRCHLCNFSHRHVNVMNQKNVGQENVKLLFHCAESKQIDAICQQNIEWRTYEAHEMAYGMGEFNIC